MRIQKFPLAGEEPPRLEPRWQGSNAAVFLDGTHQADLAGPAALKQGWSTSLEDGSTLEVRTLSRIGLPELSVLRNGQHVQSSPSHPAQMLSSSSTTLIALGAFLIATGLIGILGKTLFSALLGAFYLGGGLLLRKRSFAGVVVTIVPLALGVGILVMSAFTAGTTRQWWIDAGLHSLFVFFLVRSTMALRDTLAVQP